MNSPSLKDIFLLQQSSFLMESYPSAKKRKTHIKLIKDTIINNKEKISEALSLDFGYRSQDETLFCEIFGVGHSARHIIKNLSKWMKKEKRKVHILYTPAKNYIMYQPLGVVGIIVPWNYPLVTGIIPLMEAIAAGNRVMIKMPEHTPHLNSLLKELFKNKVSQEWIAFIEGDAQLAAEFCNLKFNHIFFTGSSETGKKVMQSASQNLTSVTLELGGKSPTILSKSAKLSKAIHAISFGKVVNAGQTCIAPDHIFCHIKHKEKFLNEFKKRIKKFYPDLLMNKDYTSIISEQQLQRLDDYISDAKSKGAEIHILLNEETNKKQKKFPLTLIMNAKPDMLIAKHEIFGPILPIYFYEKTSDVIDIIKKGERPLSMYYFGSCKKEQELLNKEIHAGSICINDTLMQIMQDSLPFGGIGYSGMGKAHGFEGFKTFSHAKAIHKKFFISTSSLLSPPYPNFILKLLYKFFI